MASHEELKTRAATTYDAAADWYDAPENTFWARFGRRTVDLVHLRPGMRVLDVCSGSGASAVPAAQAVGSSGRVVAVDISDDLLALLRTKAQALSLSQLEVRCEDLLALNFPGPGFDAVICVFGIFFVGDIVEGVRRLWRHVAPGGRLVITTWGPHLFEPANSFFWEAVRDERPDLYKGFNPWDTITEPAALEQLLSEAGVNHVQIIQESGTHALPSPSAWWALVMGSGYRGTLEQLSTDARERIKTHNLRSLAASGVTAVEANVLYAVATKSAV
jgi:ubiquinone/menaquinone biosynthesis C-methylase UbiE